MIILCVYLNDDFTKTQPVQTEKRALKRVSLGIINLLWNAEGGVPYKIIFTKPQPVQTGKRTLKRVSLGIRNRLWNAEGGVPYKIIFTKTQPVQTEKRTLKRVPFDNSVIDYFSGSASRRLSLSF